MSLTILSTTVGCEIITRVDRAQIPEETGTGGAGGTGPSSSSSSSSSGDGGMAGAGGAAGAGGSGGAAGMGGSGGGAPCTQDSDCPASGTACVTATCDMGTCTNVNAAAGTKCSEGLGTQCDGNGLCVECVSAADCPAPGPCDVAACNAGSCAVSNAPAGTVVNDPTPGDCKNEQCDANGMVVVGNDDTDVLVDGNPCTKDLCNAGTPSNPNEMAGVSCGQNNTICDGMGQCVGCLTDSDCGMPTECKTPTCNNSMCMNIFASNGKPLMDQTSGDCKIAQCDGMGGVKQVDDDTDLPADEGNACTDEACSSGVPTFPPVSVGQTCTQNGGVVCDGAGMCVECNLGTDCASGLCAMSSCQPPEVVSIVPSDAATGVSVGSNFAITFSGSMDPSTLVAQTANGPCSGSVRFSVDNFVTCYGFASAAPVMSNNNKTATFTPAPGLSFGTNYRINVTTSVTDSSGKALAANVTQPMGFATEIPVSTCGGSVVISQIYGAGGSAGAVFTHDFVELHNRGITPVNLAGWSVQYAEATGSTWQVAALSGTLAPGAYYLVQMASVANPNGVALPMPNATSNTDLSATAGKVALVSSTTPLTDACPLGGQVRDFVGYGPNANCSEGMMNAPTPSTTQSIHRKGAGCADTGVNSADTELLAVAPRNTASMALSCECPIAGTLGTANESNTSVEMDYCNVQFPQTIMVAAGQMTPIIYGRVYELGVTEAPGANGAITAELGFGPANVNPSTQSGYTFVPATFNVQVGNDDEYQASFTAPAMPGEYRYVYRFTRDGVSYTYCDKNGSGSNGGLSFEIHELPILTVMP